MRVRLFRGDRPSAGARALSRAAGIRLVRTNRSRFRARPDDVIVNWGYGGPIPDALTKGRWINPPAAVAMAINKVAALTAMEEAGVPTLYWTLHPETAQAWSMEGKTVFARTVVSGSGGDGIVVIEPGQQVAAAPLYTQYVPGREYRIHVFNGQVIDRQIKRRRNGNADESGRVRNAANGWVYCREGIEPVAAVDEAAIQAVAALSLQFAAADIRYHRAKGRVAVLELNTGPGIEGSTLAAYVRALAGVHG